MFASKLFVALAAAIAVSAMPAPEVVLSPPVTSPVAGDSWAVGSTQIVTWDTTGIPASDSTTGVILLGYLVAGSEDEHLDAAHPLASGFPITAGAVNVTVPDVVTRDDYIVVLIGSSGNASPEFTITA